ncbi:MAG: galactokinase [Candidatus Atribacteria bacterium]|nr:MAG: galactokinase [Candidatus Atribacteria bacterium]
MIITRSPLRVTLGGGGTDLPSYYKDHEGFLIAAAIDKYIYITIHQAFVEEIIIKYSQLEKVKSIKEIKHPIIREVLKLLKMDRKYLEITSMADIPAGTGLGSSGSFTVALLKALHSFKTDLIGNRELAEEACNIEINKLGDPVGKQDPYIAAFGGITTFKFLKNGFVDVKPLNIERETLYNLEDNLILFFTGYSRNSSSILKEQDDKSKNIDNEMIKNLHFVKEIGLESKKALENKDLNRFAELINIHWEYKKKRSSKMSNEKINYWYELALKNGAQGGKLVGAGGGGFLMFYTEDKKRLRHIFYNEGLREVKFRFDFEGAKVVI